MDRREVVRPVLGANMVAVAVQKDTWTVKL